MTDLYNQSIHRKKDDPVSQVCPTTGQCNETLLSTTVRAQGPMWNWLLVNISRLRVDPGQHLRCLARRN